MDEVSHRVLREFYKAGGIVSGACHGLAALCKVKLLDGSYLGTMLVTGFSDAEEDAVRLTR